MSPEGGYLALFSSGRLADISPIPPSRPVNNDGKGAEVNGG
jgi:hypothetical protein